MRQSFCTKEGAKLCTKKAADFYTCGTAIFLYKRSGKLFMQAKFQILILLMSINKPTEQS